VLNNPNLSIGLLLATWILLVSSLTLFVVPSWVLRTVGGGATAEKNRALSLLDRTAHGFIRMLSLLILGTLLWARLGLFTWFTAILTYGLSLFTIWLFGNNRHPQHKLQKLSQNCLAFVIDLYDRGISGRRLWVSWESGWRNLRAALGRKAQSSVEAFSLIIIFSIALAAIALRFGHPLQELRFSAADSYSQLLATQQILSRDVALFDAPTLAIFRVPVLAAITAFISTISGVDPVHSQHFTMSLVGCWLVAAVGYCLLELTHSLAASAVGLLGLGVYLFTFNFPVPKWGSERLQSWLSEIIGSLNLGWVRQWNPNEIEVAALFLLLGLAAAARITKPAQRLDGWISAICCWLIISIAAPPMLVLLLAGGFGLILGRRVALFAVAVTWLALALLAAIPERQLFVDPLFLRGLPIALSLLSGMVFMLLATALKGLLGIWTEPVGLTIVCALALNFFWPNNMAIEYLEYDVSAVKTMEIATLFPYKRWTLVAPSEQLSQSYRQGWYEDLARFVENHGKSVQDPSFKLPIGTPNIFVMLEKQPFGADRSEPSVPYSTLSDPVYSNYRSPRGRSRLQAAALELCETYANNHADSLVYYEDSVLKIYQFSGKTSQD
jgi:hypothetical protein